MNIHISGSLPIGEIVEPIKTWNPARECEDETFQYIDIGSVSQETKTIEANAEIPVADAPSRARQIVRWGDILVSTVRPNLNAVACVPEELDGATASTGFCVLRPARARLDNRYLFHWVRSPQFVADMAKKATGQSYPAVSDKIVKGSQIPLPPLDEQKRIAAILDQADTLRRLRQRANSRIGDFRDALFYSMFKDPRGYEVSEFASLGDYLEIIRNGANVEQFDDAEGWPVTRIETIWNGEIDSSRVKWTKPDEQLVEKFVLRDGDILFSHINSPDHIGKVALYSGTPKLLVHGINLLRLRANGKLNPVWLESYLKLPFSRVYFKNRCKKAVNQASLNQDDIRSLPILVPSLTEQQSFENRLVRIKELRSDFAVCSTKLDCLFRSIQHRAFTGQL